MLISFVIPTRNRSRELAHTLEQLECLSLDELGGSSEVIVIDNGSDVPLDLPSSLKNGIIVKAVELGENMGAGARNIGAEHAHADWVIMLDDDSNLCPGSVGEYLSHVDAQVAAVGGEIVLPDGRHESGGLPEVIVGCGCAIRRNAFLEVGGYDPSFGYYVEEYDLCAKLIESGHSVFHTMALRFEHRKCENGRNMDEILYRLVRNNGWVIHRYAPSLYRDQSIEKMLTRYEQIAIHENALSGFKRGLAELERTIQAQRTSTLSVQNWDRFSGVSAMRTSFSGQLSQLSKPEISIVGPAQGKGLEQIRAQLESFGTLVIAEDNPKALQIIGTLSPGPMLDTKRAHPNAICPWLIKDSVLQGVST